MRVRFTYTVATALGTYAESEVCDVTDAFGQQMIDAGWCTPEEPAVVAPVALEPKPRKPRNADR